MDHKVGRVRPGTQLGAEDVQETIRTPWRTRRNPEEPRRLGGPAQRESEMLRGLRRLVSVSEVLSMPSAPTAWRSLSSLSSLCSLLCLGKVDWGRHHGEGGGEGGAGFFHNGRNSMKSDESLK